MEFRDEDAGFQRLAQSDRVRDQDARARLAQGLHGGIELERQRVQRRAVAEEYLVARDRGLAECGFQVQQAGLETAGSVIGEQGLAGIQDADIALEPS